MDIPEHCIATNTNRCFKKGMFGLEIESVGRWRKLQLEIHTERADFSFLMATEASEVLRTL